MSVSAPGGACWPRSRRCSRQGEAYGASTAGRGRRVNVEYVSANPTGPMHVGHCRGAVVGDALANLLAKAGYAVTKEYYLNDAGNQVAALAWASYWRYLQALGSAVTEDAFSRSSVPGGLQYRGDYLDARSGRRWRRRVRQRRSPGPDLTASPHPTCWLEHGPQLRRCAMMLTAIRGATWTALGIRFDRFSSERALLDIRRTGRSDSRRLQSGRPGVSQGIARTAQGQAAG